MLLYNPLMTKQVNIRLAPADADLLRTLARLFGISQAAVVALALRKLQ
jgi:hypothetical protein